MVHRPRRRKSTPREIAPAPPRKRTPDPMHRILLFDKVHRLLLVASLLLERSHRVQLLILTNTRLLLILASVKLRSSMRDRITCQGRAFKDEESFATWGNEPVEEVLEVEEFASPTPHPPSRQRVRNFREHVARTYRWLSGLWTSWTAGATENDVVSGRAGSVRCLAMASEDENGKEIFQRMVDENQDGWGPILRVVKDSITAGLGTPEAYEWVIWMRNNKK
jgi:hypothetical protein